MPSNPNNFAPETASGTPPTRPSSGNGPADVLGEFHDPALKSALQRIQGPHLASPALRAAVLASIHADATSPPTHSRSFWNRSSVRVAAAACLLLSLSLSAKLAWDHHIRSHQESFVLLNQDFLDATIQAFSAANVGLKQTFPVNMPPRLLAEQMSFALGRKVDIPDASAGGWSVSSAGLIDLGNGPIAYVHFRNQSRTAAMFVYPNHSALATGLTFNIRRFGHHVSGVSTSDGIHTFITRPCAEGETDDLSELLDPVERNARNVQ